MRRILSGEKQCDIAADIGMREQSLSRIVNDPIFQVEMKKVETSVVVKMGDVREKIDDLADDAVEFLKDTLRSKKAPTSLRTRIAFFVLESAGYGKKVEPKGAGDDDGRMSENETVEYVAELIGASYEMGMKELEERKEEGLNKCVV